MGEVVGAALVAHVPTIMLPEETRREINDGNEISLVPGLHRLKSECLDRLQPDTVIVFDTHWESTFEHIVTSHERRQGKFTSHELPRGMRQVPYDMPGDPELANLIAAQAEGRDDCWILACDDPYLPDLLRDGQRLDVPGRPDTRWISVALNQCCTTEDFLLLRRAIGNAIRQSDRRAGAAGLRRDDAPVLPVQGAAARTRARPRPTTSSASSRTRPTSACCGCWRQGDHAGVIDWMPEYRRAAPEGHFGHYLMMAAAIGGARCQAPGERFSEYEASVGTGQVHVWFERPADGWTGRGAAA